MVGSSTVVAQAMILSGLIWSPPLARIGSGGQRVLTPATKWVGLCEVEGLLAESVRDDFAVLFFEFDTNSATA